MAILRKYTIMSILKANLASILATIERIFQDEELRQELIYRKFQSESFSGGVNVEAYNDLEVVGVKLKHTAKSISASAIADLQVGAPCFLFRPKDLGADTSLKDQIQFDGNTYKVAEIKNIHDLVFEVNVESGGLQ